MGNLANYPPHEHDKPRAGSDAPPRWVQEELFGVNSDGQIVYAEEPAPQVDIALATAITAASLVTGDRNSDYGHPLDDFAKQATMWSVIFGVPVTPEQVSLAMVCVKIARELNNPKDDNPIDGVGYWLTIPMIKQERARRESL